MWKWREYSVKAGPRPTERRREEIDFRLFLTGVGVAARAFAQTVIIPSYPSPNRSRIFWRIRHVIPPLIIVRILKPTYSRRQIRRIPLTYENQFSIFPPDFFEILNKNGSRMQGGTERVRLFNNFYRIILCKFFGFRMLWFLYFFSNYPPHLSVFFLQNALFNETLSPAVFSSKSPVSTDNCLHPFLSTVTLYGFFGKMGYL